MNVDLDIHDAGNMRFLTFAILDLNVVAATDDSQQHGMAMYLCY